jgi:stage V sporulation protein B
LLSRGEATLTSLARLAVAAALALGPMAVAASFGLGTLMPDAVVGPARNSTLMLACLTVFPSMAAQFLAAIVFRVGRLRSYGVLQAANAVAQLALLILVDTSGGLTPAGVLGVQLALVTLSAVVLGAVVGHHLGLPALWPHVPVALIRRAVRLGLVLHPSSIALFLNLRLDLFLVAALLDVDQAGLYSLAATLAELILAGASTVGLAALQQQAELKEPDSIAYTTAFARQSASMAFALAIVVAAVSYPVLTTVYGTEWRGAAAPLAILAFASVALAIEAPVRGLLFRLGRPALISIAALIGMLANVAIVTALVPAIGLVGAAIGSVLSYSMTAFLMLRQMRTLTGTPIRNVVRPPLVGDLAFELPRSAVRSITRRRDRRS